MENIEITSPLKMKWIEREIFCKLDYNFLPNVGKFRQDTNTTTAVTAITTPVMTRFGLSKLLFSSPTVFQQQAITYVAAHVCNAKKKLKYTR